MKRLPPEEILMKLKLICAVAFTAFAFLTGPAVAEYPERPVEVVAPWPPGDLEDVLARLISNQIQEDLGVPSAVVNMKGGGGVIGATHVYQAEADGYTLGVFTGNTHRTYHSWSSAFWPRRF